MAEQFDRQPTAQGGQPAYGQAPMYGQPTYSQPPSLIPQPSQPTYSQPSAFSGQSYGTPMYGSNQPTQPLYGQSTMRPMQQQTTTGQPAWHGAYAPPPQGTLIPERAPTTQPTPAKTEQSASTESGKDYSVRRGKKLELLPRTKRDRSLMICALLFTLVLLALSLTCLVQFPVQTADGEYMYVPQTALQTISAQLDVILNADTTDKIASANAAYLELQQKTGLDVYLGAMNVNFFTLYYEQHDPMATAGDTVAFYLLFAYSVLVPLGLLFTFLRTFFALFGKRTYATPRALLRMLMPLLFVRIYSLFNLLWRTSIGVGSQTETDLLFPLQAGLDRYNIVLGACALFSFVLVLMARRCEDTKPIKVRFAKIWLTLFMALLIAGGALVLPLCQITQADGSTASFSLMEALLHNFGNELSDGAIAVGSQMTAFSVYAKDTATADYILFLGQYLPFLACALLAFALTTMFAYVFDSTILMEHGIPDKKYARKVCNGKTSLWATIVLTLLVGTFMVLFNTQITTYQTDIQFTFNYLYLLPIGGGALLTLCLHKIASSGIKKFRKATHMSRRQFLPS